MTSCSAGTYALDVAKQRDRQIELQWSSASVSEGRLTVGFRGDPASEWTQRLTAIIDRLDRPDGRWGAIEVKRKRGVSVADVTSGCEADLRHMLDGAALQANADLAPDDDDADAGRAKLSEQDVAMTDRFRSFADDAGEPADGAPIAAEPPSP